MTIDSTTPGKICKKIRPVSLSGKTYKLKTHVYEHSFYVTINDMDGEPFEIFINTKNHDAHMWTTAVTLAWSTVFRKVYDIQFLITEMLETIDIRGGHISHERFHKSIVAEVGYILDCRIKNIPLRKSERTILVENQ